MLENDVFNLYSNNYRKFDGSITIFYSIIFMVLLTFCATIVDATRIHIATGQAQRALLIANESIIASYDSQLFEQYGILGKSAMSDGIIKNNIDYYVEKSLNPESIDAPSTYISQINSSDTEFFHLFDYEYSIDAISNKQSILNYDYINGQILEFMKYRAPINAITPFISSIESFQKSAKTTEVLGKKNEVVSQLATIINYLIQLQNNIDGLNINTTTGQFTVDSSGNMQLSQNYIKKLYVDDTKEFPIYSETSFPEENLVKALNDNIWYVDDDISAYKEKLTLMDQKMVEIINSYNTYCDIKANFSSLQDEKRDLVRPTLGDANYYNELESYHSKVNDYNDRINELKDERDEKKEQISDLIDDFNRLYNNAYELMSNLNDICDVITDGKSKQSIEYITDESINLIGLIKEESDSLKDEIDSLKAMAENEDGDYIQEACEGIYSEIERYEKILGLNEVGEFEGVNDLLAMEEDLIYNQDLLKGVEGDVATIILGYRDIGGSIIYQNLGILGDNASAFLSDRLIDIDYNNVDSDEALEDTIESLNRVEVKLDNYKRDFLFDYSNISAYIEDDFDLLMFLESKKEELNLDFGIADAVGQGIWDNNLPTSYILNSENNDVITSIDESLINDDSEYTDSEGIQSLEYQKEMDVSVESYSTVFDMLNAMEAIATDIRDEIYINEYIIGMFANASENDLFNIMVETNPTLTLNGFDKGDHYLSYEVEYLLFGHQTDIQNLSATISLIFTIRLVMNMLHIVLSSSKMAKINTLANSIGGWWSFGIGGAIIAIVMTVLWATMESIIDIKDLLKGEDVELIKTELEWKSDLFSGIKANLLEAVEDEVIKETTGTNDGITPQLSYNDYLRLLLLVQTVDSKTKIYRILDLIQLNMTKERQENVALKGYIFGFDSTASFSVNYLFLDSSFLEKVTDRSIGDYSFTISDNVSY